MSIMPEGFEEVLSEGFSYHYGAVHPDATAYGHWEPPHFKLRRGLQDGDVELFQMSFEAVQGLDPEILADFENNTVIGYRIVRDGIEIISKPGSDRAKQRLSLFRFYLEAAKG